MKGIKLIRRLDVGGLIKWAPMEGRPELAAEAQRLALYWTEGVWRNNFYYETPDDRLPSFGGTPKGFRMLAEVLA